MSLKKHKIEASFIFLPRFLIPFLILLLKVWRTWKNEKGCKLTVTDEEKEIFTSLENLLNIKDLKWVLHIATQPFFLWFVQRLSSETNISSFIHSITIKLIMTVKHHDLQMKAFVASAETCYFLFQMEWELRIIDEIVNAFGKMRMEKMWKRPKFDDDFRVLKEELKYLRGMSQINWNHGRILSSLMKWKIILGIYWIWSFWMFYDEKFEFFFREN